MKLSHGVRLRGSAELLKQPGTDGPGARQALKSDIHGVNTGALERLSSEHKDHARWQGQVLRVSWCSFLSFNMNDQPRHFAVTGRIADEAKDKPRAIVGPRELN